MNNNINKTIIIIGGLLVAGTTFAAGDAAKGKTTFEASQCMQCHSSDEMFTRKDRKVKTLPALDDQVRKCDAQLSTNLFDDEIEDVVAYLNQAYYKFPDDKKTKETTKETKNDK